MQFTSQDGPLLVIIGPSGTGKSSIIRRLADDGLIEITPSWTTRLPRPGELDEGIEHHFVSEAEFTKREAAGYFLETVHMFGLPFVYGLPQVAKPAPGKVPLVMLRAPLLASLRKYYERLVVYQIEDVLERVQERLLERQKKGEPLGSRLDDYEKEIKLGQTVADRIFVNDDIKSSARKLKKALKEDFNL